METSDLSDRQWERLRPLPPPQQPHPSPERAATCRQPSPLRELLTIQFTRVSLDQRIEDPHGRGRPELTGRTRCGGTLTFSLAIRSAS